ncbi:MAG: rhodanese-like domain-containing protein [Clostridia bacterium]|nr:rhodanese-like domain-containing protein [Clostridia bacterium]
MKGTILTAVLICSAILAACSPAAPREAMASTQSPPPPAAKEQAEATVDEAYHKITAEEAKQMMDQDNVTVVDVRTADEYAAGHIPGSILVPVESIGDAKPDALPDTEAVLLVHCRTGIRSKRASDQLVELGYKHVYDFGGIVDWPYETVKEN